MLTATTTAATAATEGSAAHGFMLVVYFLAAYMLPTWVALIRKHHQRVSILILNLLLGWTVLGWIAALVWSATAVQHQQKFVVVDGKAYPEVRDRS